MADSSLIPTELYETMAQKPKTILWELQPHSRGKHMVLQCYLKGWLRIVGTGGTNLQIIDGFAGPGEYLDGTAGSPILVHNEVMSAPAPRNGRRIFVLCVEEDSERVAHLQARLATLYPTLPLHVRSTVVQGKFTDLTSLPRIASGQLAPSFTMVDPFGVSQTPMVVLEQLLRNKSSEVYVSLMADHAARFCKDPDWDVRLTALYGTEQWRQYQDVGDHELRRHGLVTLYEAQLRRHGAAYVVSFHLYHGRIYKYSIVFGTSHPLGCGLMKTCIWNALGSDEFIASRVDPGQLAFDLDLPLSARRPEQELGLHLRATFRGQSILVDELDAWMHTDVHIYAPKHLRGALRLLEAEGVITVIAPSERRRRKLSYPELQGYKVAFTP